MGSSGGQCVSKPCLIWGVMRGEWGNCKDSHGAWFWDIANLETVPERFRRSLAISPSPSSTRHRLCPEGGRFQHEAHAAKGCTEKQKRREIRAGAKGGSADDRKVCHLTRTGPAEIASARFVGMGRRKCSVHRFEVDRAAPG